MTSPDVDACARTIYGEARNQGPQGMQAVANVIMNRVAKQTWYGKTPYDVCHKHSLSGIYQFSCWNAGDPNCTKICNVDAANLIFARCLEIAAAAVAGELEDITDGATHYFVTGTPIPAWAVGQTPCAVIGAHQFYNNIS